MLKTRKKTSVKRHTILLTHHNNESECKFPFFFRESSLLLETFLNSVAKLKFTVADAGVTSEGKEVYLCDVWPSREEVQQIEEDTVISSIFKDVKSRMEVRRRLYCNFLPLVSGPTNLFSHTLLCFPAEREHILEQHRLSRLSTFPMGS